MTGDVQALAYQQQERLAAASRVLGVRLKTVPVEQPKLIVRWRRSLPAIIDLWGRLLTPGEAEAWALDTYDASPAEAKKGKVLDVRAHARETAKLVGDLRASTAVSLESYPRSVRNRVDFYFTREVETLERIFGL